MSTESFNRTSEIAETPSPYSKSKRVDVDVLKQRLLEEDRKKVLMTYMLKHVDGIAAYVKGHKSQREDVTGRITDCMVYLMLLWGMIEEEDGLVFRKKDDSPLSNYSLYF